MRPRSRQTAALRIIAGTFSLALAMAATAQSEPCDSASAQVPGGTSSPVRTGSLRFEGLSLGVEYRL
jgi:hypothetical protein